MVSLNLEINDKTNFNYNLFTYLHLFCQKNYFILKVLTQENCFWLGVCVFNLFYLCVSILIVHIWCQKIICESQVSTFITCVVGTELRPSRFAASALTELSCWLFGVLIYILSCITITLTRKQSSSISPENFRGNPSILMSSLQSTYLDFMLKSPQHFMERD